MTSVKIIDTCKRFTAEDTTWQSAHAASVAAERYHDATGEPVQYANHDGIVLGYIDGQGRRFGTYATCG